MKRRFSGLLLRIVRGPLKKAGEEVADFLCEIGVARLGGDGAIGALLVGANPSTAVLEIR